MSLTVLAIGGHSLLDPALPPTTENQFAVARRAVGPIADLLERGERLVITHGNGPQVGFMALRSELSKAHLHEVPLDSLVADTQGAIGYMIQRALREELRLRGVEMEIVALVTEVIVDPHDHAFEVPTKPIGRFYSADEAAQLGAERGWIMRADPRGWRRVVPSPAPRQIEQLPTIARLAAAGVVVICCGGGGIPVVRDEAGHLQGIEGVIDKDHVSALLAHGLGARRLMITTAIDRIYRDWHTPLARPIDATTLAELEALGEQGQFAPGSMGPKVEAVVRFLRHGGTDAIICSPGVLVEAFDGSAGTRITIGKEGP